MLGLLRAPSSSRLNSINKPLREEDGQYRQTYSTAIKRIKGKQAVEKICVFLHIFYTFIYHSLLFLNIFH